LFICLSLPDLDEIRLFKPSALPVCVARDAFLTWQKSTTTERSGTIRKNT
jgi:hypothetical protein